MNLFVMGGIIDLILRVYCWKKRWHNVKIDVFIKRSGDFWILQLHFSASLCLVIWQLPDKLISPYLPTIPPALGTKEVLLWSILNFLYLIFFWCFDLCMLLFNHFFVLLMLWPSFGASRILKMITSTTLNSSHWQNEWPEENLISCRLLFQSLSPIHLNITFMQSLTLGCMRRHSTLYLSIILRCQRFFFFLFLNSLLQWD